MNRVRLCWPRLLSARANSAKGTAAPGDRFFSSANLKTGSFDHTRRTQSLTGPSYTVWTSTNFVNWSQDAGAIQNPGIAVNQVETVAVTLSPALLSQPRLFIRMRAE